MISQIDEWFDLISNEKSKLTAVNYRSRLEKWFLPWLKDRTFQSLKAKDIYQFRSYLIADKRLSPCLVNHILSALRSFWAFLLSNEVVSSNVMGSGYAVKIPSRLPQPLKPEGIRKIFMVERDKELRFLLILGIFAGLRLNEAMNVGVKDFNFKVEPPELMVRVGKGRKERITIILPYPKVLNEIQSYLCSGRKKLFQYRRSEIFRAMKRLAEQCRSPEFTFHKCRHTYATLLGQHGLGDDHIADLMGHSSTKTTRNYRQIILPKIRAEISRRFQ